MPSSIAEISHSMPLKRLCWRAGTTRKSTGVESRLEPSQQSLKRAPRVGFALLAAALLAAAAAYAVPRAHDSVLSLDDPTHIADHALKEKFDSGTAEREIVAALAAGDADLAQSFVDLARDRQVMLDQSLVDDVNSATAEAATIRHKVKSFGRGLITGEPDDMAALAGTAVGDLFVFGDIRDALREGKRFAAGEEADELVLGLACAGIAITAGTYLTFGAAAPARAGLTLVKVARKTGSLGAELAGNIGRMVRQAGFSGASPVLAVRAARDAVKVERAGGLLNLARDVGRVERAAGGRAAFDGLKVAKEPADVTRVARLAGKEGSRTRAILKLVGCGAITLAALAFDAGVWLIGALFAVLGFVSALKSATERMAFRYFRRRREKRRLKQMQPIAVALAHG